MGSSEINDLIIRDHTEYNAPAVRIRFRVRTPSCIVGITAFSMSYPESDSGLPRRLKASANEEVRGVGSLSVEMVTDCRSNNTVKTIMMLMLLSLS